MGHYFSRITLFTVIFATLGLGGMVMLIFTHLQVEPDLPVDIVLMAEDGRVVDTLRFNHQTQLLRDSTQLSKPLLENSITLPASTLFFHYNPYFLVWIVLIGMMVAIACGVGPSVFDRIFLLSRRFKLNERLILLLIIGVVILGVLLILLPDRSRYFYAYTDWIETLGVFFTSRNVIDAAVVVSMISGLIALLGMFLISFGVTRLKVSEKKGNFEEQFRILNRSLKFFLGVITILITFTVLTTGTFRKAILQEVSVEGIDLVPDEFVYLYGLQFTIALAVFYLPVFYQLRLKGHKYITTRNDESVSNGEIALFMKESVADNLKVAGSILAPLITSLLPEVFNF